MELQNFSIEQINNYSMWFMLNKIKDGPIELVRRTPAGDEPYTKFACFQMQNGQILLGIEDFMDFTYKNNLYAISGYKNLPGNPSSPAPTRGLRSGEN